MAVVLDVNFEVEAVESVRWERMAQIGRYAYAWLACRLRRVYSIVVVVGMRQCIQQRRAAVAVLGRGFSIVFGKKL